VALDNPPLLIVSDVGTTIRIHTNWTNSVSKVYEIPIAELGDAEKRGWLKAAFADPETLRPTKTRQQLTEEVAGNFAELARSLRARYGEPEEVAHFINRLVFCMFAEDVKLLKDGMFSRMLGQSLLTPSMFEDFARKLFRAMSKGGTIGFETVAWFNGGLFDNDRVFPLTPAEIRLVHDAAQRDWADIDPSIFGTLFERGLDPDKRSQLGAHYTDRDKIMMIIEPVIVEPLTAEWEEAKAEIVAFLEKATALDAAAKTQRGKAGAAVKGQATAAHNAAQAVLDRYLKRLGDFRVLDPACGSGNFLYLALRALKDLEHRAQVEAEALGLPRGFPRIGPEVVKGIEINPYAAELARVSVWIGEIQWMLKNGFPAQQNPVLKPLETIECRDAVLDQDGTPYLWPEVDAIIGNPPFLGGKLLRTGLGDAYVDSLFQAYRGLVPAEADFVVYWIAKAAEAMEADRVKRVGLVATNSVRGGANRIVMERIVERIGFLTAWADEAWTVEGAAVRVSLIVFGHSDNQASRHLDGAPVLRINPDLTATAADLTRTAQLPDNAGIAFMGDTKGGAFDIQGNIARSMLKAPINPNGSPNKDVVRPWINGLDVTRRPRDMWIIDFGWIMSEAEAMLYEAPYAHLLEHVKPIRETNRREHYMRDWWRHVEPRPGMWDKLVGLSRLRTH
jgi:type II restriction/modification system DNA methylase subunit YeeA